jgi:hypothetical protein
VNGQEEHDRSQETRCCCEVPHDRSFLAAH